jgi:hypothetical protein
VWRSRVLPSVAVLSGVLGITLTVPAASFAFTTIDAPGPDRNLRPRNERCRTDRRHLSGRRERAKGHKGREAGVRVVAKGSVTLL